jgi:hypothetical protein
MRLVNIPDRIQYSITPCAGGVTLCLWETAASADDPGRSFLFKIRQRVASHEEAHQLLGSYLDEFQQLKCDGSFL